eukprot:jgi/Picsp_1/3059/NSC_01281-R1_non-intrinsic abc protein 4
MEGSTQTRTLFVCREVGLFSIPPRSARGHVSGSWRIEDRIFSGVCRIVENSLNNLCEVRIEDSDSGQLFALCPIHEGQKDIAVEPAVDSSRNFAVRIEDPESKRHAFVGLNFSERAHAFDFNVALSDYEKLRKREKDLRASRTSTGEVSGSDAELLYRTQDLSFKEGEKVKLSIKKNEKKVEKNSSKGGFLGRLDERVSLFTSMQEGNKPVGLPLSASCQHAPDEEDFRKEGPTPSLVSEQKKDLEQEASTKVVASGKNDWATF